MNRVAAIAKAIVLTGACAAILVLIGSRHEAGPGAGSVTGAGPVPGAAEVPATDVPARVALRQRAAPTSSVGNTIVATDECFLATSYRDGVDPTMDAQVRAASNVILVEVIGVGAPRWNTVDGAEPQGDRRPTPRDVVTPVVVQITESLKGDLSAGRTETVEVPGGEIGCNRYRIDGIQPVAKGDAVAMFLTDLVRPTGGTSRSLSTMEIWPVIGSKVQTPVEGSVNIAVLRSAATP